MARARIQLLFSSLVTPGNRESIEGGVGLLAAGLAVVLRDRLRPAGMPAAVRAN